MEFLQPTYLWGLTGLAVPVAIHLWSRRTFKVIPWGMTKFLPEESSRKASSLHWEDTLLFIVRALIWILIILLLAQPVFYSVEETRCNRVLVAPELLKEKNITQILDTIQETTVIHLLDKGLPIYEEDIDYTLSDTVRNYWSLLRQVPFSHTTELTVISRLHRKNFEGPRPALPVKVHWIEWPSETEKYEGIAVSLKNRAYQSVVDDYFYLFQPKEKVDEAPKIRYALHNLDQKNLVSIEALMGVIGDHVVVQQVEKNPDIIFSHEPREGGQINIVLTEAENRLFRKKGTDYLLSKSFLKTDNVLIENLILKMYDLFIKEGLIPDGFDKSDDYRQLQLAQVIPEIVDDFNYQRASVPRSFTREIFLFLIMLISLERFLSLSRR